MFILDCRNDVRQKENLSHFLLKFKMGHKAVETTCNINSALGPGTANESTGPVVVQEILQRKQEP